MFLNDNRQSDIGIKRSASVPAFSSEFDKFLHASVGRDNDEVPTSVLSAPARQNIDPWQEADELSHLSQDAAVARLTTEITSAKAGACAHTGLTIPSHGNAPSATAGNFSSIIIYLTVGAIIIASALLGN